MSVCARKGARSTVCVCVHAHAHTRAVYLIPARPAPSMPALPLLQQLAHNVSPLGVTKEEKKKKRRRRGCSERGGKGEECEWVDNDKRGKRGGERRRKRGVER